ncbi:acyl-ACP--UDP-N-acetylglucosamine O-acyltransferase [Litoribrevibacter euphylliae]|uniref:Acyl-[acyl-carrier-protein]--UDP-N-acetylglucosamine O-acyltransferase n=1 Tax=Litoribrevibacter euphylliae TaxID=1834034 RepID=A0ABV7HCU6_9GAMM
MIDPRAIIDPSAEIADGVEIGPWTIVGPDVVIGEGTVISSHVVIKGPTVIGKNNRIFQFSSVGEDCQDKKYAGEPTKLTIGDNNIIREGVTIHRGTVQDEGITVVGSGNLIMCNAHIAHDVIIGNNCIMANNAMVAGHVHVGDFAILGGGTGVHQFSKIGAHAMIGGGSAVNQDVPAYVIGNGNPMKPAAINMEGLKRRGFEKEDIKQLRNCYKLVYRQGLRLEEALKEIEPMAAASEAVKVFYDSILASTRGIVR